MMTTPEPQPNQCRKSELDHAANQKAASGEILTLAQAVQWIGETRRWGSWEINRLAWFVENEPTVALAVSLMSVMIPHCKDVFAQPPNDQELSHAAGDFRQPETRSAN